MVTPHHRVVIVGTGFSGLGMAIRLAQRGDDDYVVLEKADDVGGTWRDNRYPGCACDVPSRLYSLLLRPEAGLDAATSPPPPRSGPTCATSPTATALRERIVFGADLMEATYDERRGAGRSPPPTGADGRPTPSSSASGALHEP